jgi:hypothetical protein
MITKRRFGALECIALGVVAVVATATAMPAIAALPPRAPVSKAEACKLQAAAAEVVAIRIVSANGSTWPQSNPGAPGPGSSFRDDYEVEVTEVVRSASGLKRGDRISVRHGGYSAYREIPTLKTGAAYPAAYLRIDAGRQPSLRIFEFAARSKSLEAIPETECAALR